MSNNISTMYTKSQNLKAGRKGYTWAMRYKGDDCVYDELQLKAMPKPPKPIKSILVAGMDIISPSKLLMLHTKTELSAEERLYLESEAKYFDDILKHKVYTRQASRNDWKKLYRKYLKERRQRYE